MQVLLVVVPGPLDVDLTDEGVDEWPDFRQAFHNVKQKAAPQRASGSLSNGTVPARFLLTLVGRVDVFEDPADALERFEDPKELTRRSSTEVYPGKAPLEIRQMPQEVAHAGESERRGVAMNLGDSVETRIDVSAIIPHQYYSQSAACWTRVEAYVFESSGLVIQRRSDRFPMAVLQ